MPLLASQITFKHERQVLETATIAYILDDSLYGMTARKGCPNVPNLWVCVSSIPLLYPCLLPSQARGPIHQCTPANPPANMPIS